MQSKHFSLAPLQGITDHVFRNLFFKHFQGLDKAYTPFVRFEKELKIKNSQLNDLKPENNTLSKTIPQVLSNQPDEILFFGKVAADFGYQEINLNMGCPYPMVTNRQMGSGILPFPDKIQNLLEKVYKNLKIKMSVKLRLGYFSPDEIYPIINIMNSLPVSEIIIHTRIGKQMYKGLTDPESFQKCMQITMHKLYYNGDIKQINDFYQLKEKLPSIENWMIGRAAISNPFIFEEILSKSEVPLDIKKERFSEFHAELVENYAAMLSGPGHLVAKMLHFWEYFSVLFENQHKVYKMIKKANSIVKFNGAIHQIFNEFELKQ